MKTKEYYVVTWILMAVVVLIFIAVLCFLLQTTKGPQKIDVPKAEETIQVENQTERLEILKKGLERDFEIFKKLDDRLFYLYRIVNFFDYSIEEYIYVSKDEQTYYIEGRGEEVFEVRWKGFGFDPPRTLRYTVKKKGDKLELEKGELSEEKIEELFKKGRQHYLEVRKFFGVDTNEGLKKLLREKSKVELEFK